MKTKSKQARIYCDLQGNCRRLWLSVDVVGVCSAPCGITGKGEVSESTTARDFTDVVLALAAAGCCDECWEALDLKRCEVWGRILSKRAKAKR